MNFIHISSIYFISLAKKDKTHRSEHFIVFQNKENECYKV